MNAIKKIIVEIDSITNCVIAKSGALNVTYSAVIINPIPEERIISTSLLYTVVRAIQHTTIHSPMKIFM